MEKMNYKLSTVSSLVISPRASLAFYEELEEFSKQQVTQEQEYVKKDKLKVIYPFYQYGEYTKYAPDAAEYYLPGSSIKGALCTCSKGKSLMVDDITVPNKDIVLRNLYKAQYLDKAEKSDKTKACFDVFFENVGVEMVRAGVTLEGEFNIDGIEAVNALLEKANELTKSKMQQMLSYLCELIEGYNSEEATEKLLLALKEVQYKLECLKDNNNIFLLGGYKGLLHSMEAKGSQEKITGAIFIDCETKLPHGLVKIELLK